VLACFCNRVSGTDRPSAANAAGRRGHAKSFSLIIKLVGGCGLSGMLGKNHPHVRKLIETALDSFRNIKCLVWANQSIDEAVDFLQPHLRQCCQPGTVAAAWMRVRGIQPPASMPIRRTLRMGANVTAAVVCRTASSNRAKAVEGPTPAERSALL